MNKTKFCILYVVVISAAWLILTIEDWGFGGIFHLLKAIGSLSGVIGYTLFSVSLVLATRWKQLENWFGGLDKIYHFHRNIGISGFIFILMHPLILIFRKVPHHILHFFLPFHGRFSMNLGVYAFWLMVILLGITILKLLPYHLWKISHKFMSLVFLLASFHFFLSTHLIDPEGKSKLLLIIPFTIGLISIFYKQLFFYFKKSYKYQVIKTRKVSQSTLEIFIKPKNEKISFIPGQYAFFTFIGSKITKESHPFTLCGEPTGSENSILVKNRGDYTHSLIDHIKPGDLAYIEGPHGRFDFSQGGKNQIWIAGGIGIVPFVSWVKLIDSSQVSQKKIDLFYSFHDEKDKIYSELFQKVSNKRKQFRFFPICTSKKGHLNAKKIEETTGSLKTYTIFMCGPKKMTRELKKQFIELGVKKDMIIFEDFEFF